MVLRVIAAILCSISLAMAEAPSTRPVRPAKPVQTPATRPAQKVEDKFPSAKEMAERLLSQKKTEAEQLKIAFIDLDQPIAEKPAEFALFADNSLTLQSVLKRLKQAETDKDVRGVLLNFGTTDFNLAQAQEIRDAIVEVRKAGKRVFCYSDSYDTATYIAASASKDICLMSGGEIKIPGVGFEAMFAKGLLDKLGVKADYVQIGQYKGADEQYTRTEPSAEMRGEMNKILDSMFDLIVDGIAYQRNISKNEVRDMINGVMLSARSARQRGFIDHLVDQDGLRDLMKKELGRDINLLAGYGLAPREEVDLSNPLALLMSLSKKKTEESDKPKIALIYAEGVIVDGSGGGGLLSSGGSIGSEDMRTAMRLAARDPDIDAIVLRIDSPGGSALASEVMYQAVKRVARDKPVIVSIGGMAASGGYYLACAGDHIIADPSAIVGSIGVVGGKFVLKDLFEKVGLHTEEFSRGGNATLFSMNKPFSEPQRRLVVNWMTQTYEQFTDRVSTSRGKKIKDIDDIAHGRIFVAKQARDLGMVDELGGLDKAIALAASRAKLLPGSYDVKVIPGTRTLGDLLRGDGFEARNPLQPRISVMDELLATLAPRARAQLAQQLQVIKLLQNRPVMLVSPYVIQLK